ncbi:hypothetical protein KIN20_023317 [Parelaphostrongylus tenuis]|uniref:Uncharacterized protein n=1 Tax=Parelaphostrongylus tenuis TaxID=148309 RepID=A0AAD5MVG3_PARTN|nr:hypothetical protein KIN20_023317 [Parelaphostrongylus tenuis]
MRRYTQTTFENINHAQTQGFVPRRTVLRFIAEPSAENINLEDQLRFGCSREFNQKAVIEAIEEIPTLLIGVMTDDFGCGHETITLPKRSKNMQILVCKQEQ